MKVLISSYMTPQASHRYNFFPKVIGNFSYFVASDLCENFPFDFSASFIINKLESIGYNKNSIILYKKWREGCSINSNNILL